MIPPVKRILRVSQTLNKLINLILKLLPFFSTLSWWLRTKLVSFEIDHNLHPPQKKKKKRSGNRFTLTLCLGSKQTQNVLRRWPISFKGCQWITHLRSYIYSYLLTQSKKGVFIFFNPNKCIYFLMQTRWFCLALLDVLAWMEKSCFQKAHNLFILKA